MKKALFAGLALAAFSFFAPGKSHAQVFTPTFQAPRTSNDIGVYLSDIGDFGVEGILRRNFGTYDLGLRLGVASFDGASLLLGADLRSPLHMGTAPIDMSVTAGAQAVLGDVDGAGFQMGLSIGHTFVAPELSITPYIHPRLALLTPLGRRDDKLDLDLLADIGFDVAFSRSLTLRLGVGLADRGADWGIGLAWR
jgi:hypothetical protein